MLRKDPFRRRLVLLHDITSCRTQRLKGTGFSPYINGTDKRGLAPEGHLAERQKRKKSLKNYRFRVSKAEKIHRIYRLQNPTGESRAKQIPKNQPFFPEKRRNSLISG